MDVMIKAAIAALVELGSSSIVACRAAKLNVQFREVVDRCQAERAELVAELSLPMARS